jgi:hypothetical protein
MRQVPPSRWRSARIAASRCRLHLRQRCADREQDIASDSAASAGAGQGARYSAADGAPLQGCGGEDRIVLAKPVESAGSAGRPLDHQLNVLVAWLGNRVTPLLAGHRHRANAGMSRLGDSEPALVSRLRTPRRAGDGHPRDRRRSAPSSPSRPCGCRPLATPRRPPPEPGRRRTDRQDCSACYAPG